LNTWHTLDFELIFRQNWSIKKGTAKSRARIALKFLMPYENEQFCTMGMAKKQEQDYARMLYTQERLTFIEVAERTGVSPKTVSKWCKDFGWDNIRKSLLITKQTQIAQLYDQLEWLNSEIAKRDSKIATSKEADVISKITSSIKKMEVDASLAEVIEVGRSFIDFVKDVDFSKAKDITSLFDLFIQNKMK
jgi:transcriptional regulator with XRE-family HTH domain